MSLHPQAGYQVPEETQRVARAVFPTRGQPAEAPVRLVLITVLQFAEPS